MRLAKLERRLGTLLFVRTRWGLTPTDAGQRLHRTVRPLVADLDRLMAEVAALGQAGTPVLRVGLVPAADEDSALAEALAQTALAWRVAVPGYRLQVTEALSGELRRQVLNGMLDFAIVDDDLPQPGLAVQRIVAEPLAVVRHGDAVGPCKVRLMELPRLRLVLPARRHGLRAIIDRAAADQHLLLVPAMEIDSMATAVRLARTGDWCTVLPISAVRHAVASGALRADTLVEPTLERRLSLVRCIGKELTTAGRTFVGSFVRFLRAAIAPEIMPAGKRRAEPQPD
jgi:DNA-binding transcriptional LysR family regulator